MKGYVARDWNDELFFYSEMPRRNKINFSTTRYGTTLQLDSDEFPALRWEDEPIEVEFTIKEV